MKPPTPAKTLLLIGGVAAVTFLGGLRLARQSRNVRVERGRENLREFTDRTQDQLRRLESLYEEHLTSLARDTPSNPLDMRHEAGRIVGVQGFSLLHPQAEQEKDRQVNVTAETNQRVPVPVFSKTQQVVGETVLLEEARFLGGGAASGWIEQPSNPRMYFVRRSRTELAVLTIDAAAVQSAVSEWLRQWAVARLGPAPASWSADLLRVEGGETLATNGNPVAAPPDFLLLLRSELGAWELASWDERREQVSYDAATVAGTATLTVFIAGLGALVFVQQRKTLLATAQRVSFVNRVSHELRTPLTNIQLNIDLASDAAEDVPQEAIRRLALVREEGQRLGRLIDNILTFARQERGETAHVVGGCVPDQVIARTIEQFAPAFERRGLRVQNTGQADARCRLDADALAQILANLLSNVEKYVPGGTVKIRSSLDDGMLSLRVEDDGPGIPAGAADRVFRPFERLCHRANEGAAGVGLGLAIARDLAEEMSGSLRLVLAEKGAVFELQVAAPLASSEMALVTA